MNTPDRVSEISLGMRRWPPCPATDCTRDCCTAPTAAVRLHRSRAAHCDKQHPMHAGILANMACHSSLQGRLAGAARLQQAVLQALLTTKDAGCICEACRLLTAVMAGSHASAWLSCITEDLSSRVTWLLEATQNSDVLERCSPDLPGGCASLASSNGHELHCTHQTAISACPRLGS